ncbi:hypothetical protein ACMA5I_07310 [Paracoccaceae bacterium GXU_MW_L88]
MMVWFACGAARRPEVPRMRGVLRRARRLEMVWFMGGRSRDVGSLGFHVITVDKVNAHFEGPHLAVRSVCGDRRRQSIAQNDENAQLSCAAVYEI